MMRLFRGVSVLAVLRSTGYMTPEWIGWGVVGSIVCVLLYMLYRHRTITHIIQSLALTLLARVCVLASLWFYQYRYETGVPHAGNYTGMMTITQNHSSTVSVVSLGDRLYRRRHDEQYPRGTQLRAIATITDESLPLMITNPQSQRSRVMTGEMDRPQWLRMRGLHGTIRTSQLIVQGQTTLARHQQMRSWLLRQITTHLHDTDHQALLAGMLIGDRSLFVPESYQSFIDSGLVHIVAVSGGNLVMIMVFLGLLLRWVPFRLRMIVMIGAVVVYVLVVGPDSSIIRAAIMGILTLRALMVGRLSNFWHLVMIASLLMLWRNPYLLRHDIGFLFSFAALIGVALMRPYATKTTQTLRDRPRWIRQGGAVWTSYMLPTLGATGLIAPFLLLFTDTINILSPLANLLVLPMVPLVMIGGLGAVLVADWVPQLMQPLEWGLTYIIRISDMIREYGPRLFVTERWFVLCMMVIILLYALSTYYHTTKISQSDN